MFALVTALAGSGAAQKSNNEHRWAALQPGSAAKGSHVGTQAVVSVSPFARCAEPRRAELPTRRAGIGGRREEAVPVGHDHRPATTLVILAQRVGYPCNIFDAAAREGNVSFDE